MFLLRSRHVPKVANEPRIRGVWLSCSSSISPQLVTQQRPAAVFKHESVPSLDGSGDGRSSDPNESSPSTESRQSIGLGYLFFEWQDLIQSHAKLRISLIVTIESSQREDTNVAKVRAYYRDAKFRNEPCISHCACRA